MQKEGPAAGPELGVRVGSCLIPGNHIQNGKMVIRGGGVCHDPEVLWASLGDATEGEVVPSASCSKTYKCLGVCTNVGFNGGSK